MRCLLDLDGVLVDFHAVWAAHHDVTPDWSKGYDLTVATTIKEADFWNNIDDKWWSELPWTEDGPMILKIIEKYFQPQDICLVSRAPWYDGYHHVGPSGKVLWITRHMPAYLDRYMIGTHRHWMTDSILVDDSEKNCEQHIGQSILVPRPWNKFRDYEINVPEYIEWRLSQSNHS